MMIENVKVPLETEKEINFLKARIFELERNNQQQGDIVKDLDIQKNMIKLLIDESLDSIMILSEDKIIYANQKSAELMKSISPANLIWKSIYEFIHQDSLGIFSKKLKDIKEKPSEAQNFKAKIIALDRSDFDVDIIIRQWSYQDKPTLKLTIHKSDDKKMDVKTFQEFGIMFRSLVENAATNIMILDRSGTIKFANQISPEFKIKDIIGTSIHNHIPAFEQRILRDAIFELAKNTKKIDFELLGMRLWKSNSIFQASITPIILEGQMIAVSLMGTDITKFKETEIRLLEKDADLKALFDLVDEGVYIIDKTHTIITANSLVVGWFPESAPIIGKKCYHLFHNAEFPCEQCPCINTMKTGKPSYYANHHKQTTNDGEKVFAMNVSPLFYPNRVEIQHAVVCVKDITAAKRAEEALNVSKKLFQITIDELPFPIYWKDSNLIYLGCNNKFLDQIKTSNIDKVTGKTNRDIGWITNVDELDSLEKTVLEENKPSKSIKQEITRSDGNPVLFEFSHIPFHDSNGKPIGLIGICDDLTAKKNTESELVKSRKFEYLSNLAKSIANDYNNILTGITGNLSLAMVFTNPSENIFKILSKAQDAAMKAKDLTAKLTTFAGAGTMEKKPASIVELIKETTRTTLQNSICKYTFSFPPNLYAIEIDNERLKQAISNLLINSREAMDEGGNIIIGADNITIAKDNQLSLPAGKFVKIMIEDHGSGINNDNITSIFDPFFSTKRGRKGLGLAIVYSIIASHNGRIFAESTPFTKTVFSIYLPAYLEKSQDAQLIRDLQETKKKILYVERNEKIRETTISMLEQMGYDVEWAKEEVMGIKQFRTAIYKKQPFDAIITDLSTHSGMNSLEMIKKLRKIDPDIRTILVTETQDDPLLIDYPQHGFAGALPKPYSLEDIQNVLSLVVP
jgi:two-component system, cell cycle sensor histidine kinase and response regulator CckA